MYVRAPASLLLDAIFVPPFPRMLMNPRTVCFYQPVAAMISINVAPLFRLISAMTWSFLLVNVSFDAAGTPIKYENFWQRYPPAI